MKVILRVGFLAFALGLIFVNVDTANAQWRNRGARREYREDVRDARQDYWRRVNQGNYRKARREYREDIREARRDYRRGSRWNRGRWNNNWNRGWNRGRWNNNRVYYGRRYYRNY